jgi:hypothetical protein
MDLNLLHNVYRGVTREAYNDYKHYITNAIFEVTDNVINVEINHMKATIRQKTNNKYFIDPKYPKQYEIKEKIVKAYLKSAVKKARLFAKL